MEVGVVVMIMAVIMAETVMWKRGGSSVRVSVYAGGNSIGSSINSVYPEKKQSIANAILLPGPKTSLDQTLT